MALPIDKLITRFRPVYHKSNVINELREDNYTQFEDNFWNTVIVEFLPDHKMYIYNTNKEVFSGGITVDCSNFTPLEFKD